MSNRKRIVIIGATSSIAEHCARLWLKKEPVELTLVGRNAERLERVATDLRIRSPESEVCILQSEFLDPAGVQGTVASISEQGKVDIVLIAHGSLPDQADCQEHLTACHDALVINGISPVLYAEAFTRYMEQADHGTLALIGSVAGDRGRQSNYVYGAAKGLIARYAQGLQHRFASTGVKVVLIKPGPTATPMTAHLTNQGIKLASVEDVARSIVDGINTGRAVIYTPARWRVIILIIMHIPSIIFGRIRI